MSATNCKLALAVVMAVGLAACTVPNPAFRRGDRGDAGLADDALPLQDRVAGPDTSGGGTGGGGGGAPDLAPGVATDVAKDAAPGIAPDVGSGLAPDAAGDRPGGDADPALAALRAGLVGYWKMDQPAGSRVAPDSVGVGQDGALEGLDPANAWTAGKFGSGLRFPSGDRSLGVRVEATASIRAIQRFTLAAWVLRTGTSAGWNTVISRQAGNLNAELFNLLIWSDVLRVYAPYSGTTAIPVIVGTAPVPLGRWFHVATTYDGSTVILYQEGVEVARRAGVAPAVAEAVNPLYIGTNKNMDPSLSEPFVGTLDEVMLYEVALSPAAILALKNAPGPLIP